ncbi:MAG: hypothetical protein JHC30_06245 [Caldisericum sp.]|jgi:hypothetical protein|nr:hypothetical protein [Caldisericum sp.]
MIKSRLFDEMEKRGYKPTEIFELTEFDQWVNDAMREDLLQFGEGFFGLQFWSWRIYEAPFENVKNFQFDMVFRNEDKERVFEVIEKYEKREIDARECVHRISEMAVFHCIWV